MISDVVKVIHTSEIFSRVMKVTTNRTETKALKISYH